MVDTALYVFLFAGIALLALILWIRIGNDLRDENNK